MCIRDRGIGAISSEADRVGDWATVAAGILSIAGVAVGLKSRVLGKVFGRKSKPKPSPAKAMIDQLK